MSLEGLFGSPMVRFEDGSSPFGGQRNGTCRSGGRIRQGEDEDSDSDSNRSGREDQYETLKALAGGLVHHDAMIDWV